MKQINWLISIWYEFLQKAITKQTIVKIWVNNERVLFDNERVLSSRVCSGVFVVFYCYLRCFFIVKTFFYVFLLLTLNMFWLAMMPIGIPSRSTTGFINGSTHWKLISLPQNESKTSHKLWIRYRDTWNLLFLKICQIRKMHS